MAASHALTENWQAGKTLVECNQYMLEHDIADVTFILNYKQANKRSSKPVHVRALKTLLLARSSVFYAMFCGELAENSNNITITDVEPRAFKQLIRFIYMDDVHLTSDNVLHVLYAANKYMVSSLADRCGEFLEEKLAADNAAVLLEQSMFFDVQSLKKKVLDKIASQTTDVLKSDAFCELSKQGLQEILSLADMNCTELEVFQACIRWATKQCQPSPGGDQKQANHPDGDQKQANRQEELQDNPPGGEELREALGDCLFQIRFPALSVDEFNDEVLPYELLTDREGLMILRHFTAKSKPGKLTFPLEARRNPYIPHMLKFSEFTQLSKSTGMHISCTLQCQLSRTIVLTKLLIHCPPNTGSYQQYVKVNVLKKNLSILNKNDQIVPSGSKPTHHEVDVPQILIEEGDVRLDISLFINKIANSMNQAYHYHQQQQHIAIQSSAASTSHLSDHYISLDFQPVQENLLLGIEYKLPE